MLTLAARVTRGPDKGAPLRLARNRRGKIVTAATKDAARVEHDDEDAAIDHVFSLGHGAFFSRDGRGGHVAFHKSRRARR